MTAHTVADLCERYSVSEGTVLAWIRSGELAAVNVGRIPGGKKPRWRVTPEALAAFEQTRGSGGPPAAPPKPRRPAAGEKLRFF